MKFIEKFLAFIGAAPLVTVDSIVGKVQSAVVDLTFHAHRQYGAALDARDEAQAALERAVQCEQDAERADRIAAKLRELLA